MEKMSQQQRMERIMELAGDDISVVANITITHEGIAVPTGKSFVLTGNLIVPKLQN